MKKIFFDFDDVLFDTARFKQAHIEVFVRHGIERDVFFETYEAARERSGALNYQFETHMTLLHERVEFDDQALRDDLAAFTEMSYEYIFPDVHEALQYLVQNGYMLYLVTFGTIGWQDKKVAGSGIDGFFEKVIVGEIDKGSVIAEHFLDTDANGWFVDDRAEYLAQAEQACPRVVSILMQRPEGRFGDAHNEGIDCKASSLQDVVRLIEGSQIVSE